MERRAFLQQLLVLGGATSGLTGCGTILHHDRIHKSHSRDIDWKVAALNGLGLAFFFVPGVVAFVVDFYTGAIYLPPKHSGRGYAKEGETQPVAPFDTDEAIDNWKKVLVPPSELEPERIEQVIHEEAGDDISLNEPSARVSRLTNLKDLNRHRQLHSEDTEFGMTPETFFASLGQS